MNPITNILTVDVEEYYHGLEFEAAVPPDDRRNLPSRVEGSVERVLRLLDAARTHATFFVVGCVARQHPGMIKQIATAGHEVACHSDAHKLVSRQTIAEFREDVRRSKATLEDLIGTAVLGYRAPNYSITEDNPSAFDVLLEEGFSYDSSVYPIRHDRYGFPSAPRFPYVVKEKDGRNLWELPLGTVRALRVNFPIGGGGFFRLLPYQFFRTCIRRVNERERQPVTFYFHPWELDPDQPRPPMPYHHAFRHYVNLRTTEKKLARLLRDFRFAPARRVLGLDEVAGSPSRRSNGGQVQAMNAVRLSVVVPTKDRPHHLIHLYEALLQQSRLPDEVIVVDQSLSDQGKTALADLHRERTTSSHPLALQFVHDPSISGAAAARNAGFHRSRGDFVAFIDDDMGLCPDTLRQLEQALLHRSDIAVTNGILTNYPRLHWRARLLRTIFSRGCFADRRAHIHERARAQTDLAFSNWVYGGCMLWRRWAFQASGGFHPRYAGSSVGEDAEISQRTLQRYPSMRIAFVPGAWVTNNGGGGEWRSRDRREETIVVSSHFLLTQQRSRHISSLLAFGWLMVGVATTACASSVRHRTTGPLRSLFRGFSSIASNYAGCEFLRTGPAIPAQGLLSVEGVRSSSDDCASHTS